MHTFVAIPLLKVGSFLRVARIQIGSRQLLMWIWILSENLLWSKSKKKPFEHFLEHKVSKVTKFKGDFVQTTLLNAKAHDRHFFKYIFLNETLWFSNKILLKYVPYSVIDKKSAIVNIMAWHLTGNMPLFQPIKAQFTSTYIYIHHSSKMS